jgi:hypothetical protein
LNLIHHANFRDDHRLVDRLAHVVKRERRYTDARQRLHLDAGLGFGLNRAGDFDGVCPNAKIDLDLVQRQRMAERNEIGRPLDGLNARYPRHAQHVSFRKRFLFQQPDSGRLTKELALRRRPAKNHGFAAHIDHGRRSFRIKMAEFFRFRHVIRGAGFG